MGYRKNIFSIIAILSFFIAQTALAGSATLSWTPNGESDLAGYRIYYRTSGSAGTYTQVKGNGIAVPLASITPSAPSYVVPSLVDGTTYYFAITAYDASGNESTYSSEVSKLIPTPTPTPPPSGGDTAVTNVKLAPKLEGATSVSGRSFTITFRVPGTNTQIAQFSATADTSGNVTVPSTTTINAGTYDVLVDSTGYLQKKQVNVSISSNITITTIPTLPTGEGDLNNDNTVDALDWSLMSPKWFTNDPTADINNDTIVNTIDFSLLNKNWGKGDK